MKDDVSQLTQLGSKQTDYVTSGPHAGMLETFPNKFPERDYIIYHTTNEMTSRCPKTGQPDFATVEIKYVADKLCVESKSLKLYIFAYRDEGSFMESICNKFLNDLLQACDPKAMQITMTFNARGGITTKVVAKHGDLL